MLPCGQPGTVSMHRDDIDHHGSKIDWGQWAITCDDPDFGGQGSQDTGEDYGPAPGPSTQRCSSDVTAALSLLSMHFSQHDYTQPCNMQLWQTVPQSCLCNV